MTSRKLVAAGAFALGAIAFVPVTAQMSPATSGRSPEGSRQAMGMDHRGMDYRTSDIRHDGGMSAHHEHMRHHPHRCHTVYRHYHRVRRCD